MLTRKAKELFYVCCGPLLKINGMMYRWFRAPKSGQVKVHLGPGQKRYLPGWINVDANTFTGKCDVWADLRNPLPFHDNSVDVFYSHHMIEHLPDLYSHFREMYRCLKPGGIFRVGGPNGDSAIKKFAEGDVAWFRDYPDNRRSLGGRFENFIFCRKEHLTILTYSFLSEICADVGLGPVKLVQPCVETNYPEFIDSGVLGIEWEPHPTCPRTLLVEGRKPEGNAPPPPQTPNLPQSAVAEPEG